MFGLPVEGVAIILAIDQFLDMGRTATNVVGNAVATSVITKWEGMLEVEEPEFVEHPHAPAHTIAGGKAGLELAEDMVDDRRTAERRSGKNRRAPRESEDRRKGDRRS